MDIFVNIATDGAIDDEFDQREWASLVHQSTPYYSPHILDSPAHTTYFSDHFACTSSRALRATLDDILSELHAQNAIDVERDSMIHAMQQQQTEMMQYIHQMQQASRQQTPQEYDYVATQTTLDEAL